MTQDETQLASLHGQHVGVEGFAIAAANVDENVSFHCVGSTSGEGFSIHTRFVLFVTLIAF